MAGESGAIRPKHRPAAEYRPVVCEAEGQGRRKPAYAATSFTRCAVSVVAQAMKRRPAPDPIDLARESCAVHSGGRTGENRNSSAFRRPTVEDASYNRGSVNTTDATERVPIQADADGVIRVASTRVPLDTLVAAFDAGATAEEIVQQYPAVALADVYSVIAYYLRHHDDIRAYLAARAQEANHVREENERRFNASGVRNRLLARRL